MASIIPALPPRPTAPSEAYTVVTGYVDSSRTVFGQTIDKIGDAPGTYFNPSYGSPLVYYSHEFYYDWQLINNGTIWNVAPTWSSTAVRADRFINNGTVVCEVTIPFTDVSTTVYGFARGVLITDTSSGALNGAPHALDNNGTIMAIGSGNGAIGVYSQSVYDVFVNAGVIAAKATYGHDHTQSGGAIGINLVNGGNLVNQAGGQILAEGDALAYAVWLGRGIPSVLNTGPELRNAGLIQAATTDPTVKSIGIYAVNLPGEEMIIENSGTIRADIAIYAPSDSGTFTSAPIVVPQVVHNLAGGLIEGDIELFRGDDSIDNHGTINGLVDMGEGNDRFDGTGGVVHGLVDMGVGDDTFIGGSGDDTARGGLGNDTLSGGDGADLLIGDFGDDTLTGGLGNDGLYGGNGNDRFVLSGGDVAMGGYGDDRFEAADYAFARIDGEQGFDTWVLPSGTRALDLSLVAAGGRVTGIEQISMGGGKTIVVHPADVAALSGGTTLILEGTATDSVYLAGSWVSQGHIMQNGVTYQAYGSGSATLLVDLDAQILSTAPGAAGLDAVAAGPSAALPGAISGSALLGNTLVVNNLYSTTDLTIGRDDIYRSDNGKTVLGLGPIGRPSFVNYGAILSQSDTGSATAIGQAVTDAAPNGFGTAVFATFENAGTITAAAGGSGNARAFFSAGQGKIHNSGLISASAVDGDATAVLQFDGGSPSDPGVANTARISATSLNGFAEGVFLFNGGSSLNNSGTITADGGDGAIAVDMLSGGLIDNSGYIIASAASTSTYFSVGVASSGYTSIKNSGTIAGDIAINFIASSGSYLDITNSRNIIGAIILSPHDTGSSANMQFLNTGKIQGDIYIDPDLTQYASASMQFEGHNVSAANVIVNQGTITGNIWLGNGNDVFDTRGGTVSGDIHGGGGDDRFYVGGQNNLIFEDAGGGTDTVVSSGNYYLYANIENLTLATGAGDIFGVGNELANVITGNEGSNLLIAGAGADVVHGGGGADSLFGQDGNDQLYGDAGVDYLVGGTGDDMLDGGTGADALYGEDGNDVLWGGTDFATDILVGGAGNDVLHGDSGLGDYDLMDGGSGDDTYYVDTPADLTFEAAGGGNDTVHANIVGAGYYLYANVENLILDGITPFGVGNELNNQLTGNASANYLLGGAGDDVLNGKAGNDVLFGESGADTFVFEHGTGADVIGDFTAGTDKIDLTAIGYSWQQVLNSLHENGGNTAIDLGGGDLVVLNGVTAAQLHASDFILAGAGATAAATAYLAAGSSAAGLVGGDPVAIAAIWTLDPGNDHSVAHLPWHESPVMQINDTAAIVA